MQSLCKITVLIPQKDRNYLLQDSTRAYAQRILHPSTWIFVQLCLILLYSEYAKIGKSKYSLTDG